MEIGVARLGEIAVSAIVARSARALDAPLAYDAVLAVARVRDEGVVRGAFQRARHGEPRRGSGGASVRVGAGTLWVTLALAHSAALVACAPSQIVNRHVRPLLRALTRLGAQAHYFGRDWVSVAHRPCAAVAFAHDAGTRRAVFEAVVAVTHPFAGGTGAARASFRGKAPGTIEEIVGKRIDLDGLEHAIVDSYANAYGRTPRDIDLDLDRDLDHHLDLDDPPWLATTTEAIGEIGAGPDARGVFRVGGDLMASRDAMASLEARAALAPLDAIPSLVAETLTAPGVAIDGVRDLSSLARTIAEARLHMGKESP